MKHGFAIVLDDPVAAIVEGEGFFKAFGGGINQLEAVGVVVVSGVESIARGGEQVDVVAGHVVNQVEVAHVEVLNRDLEGVATVLFGLEADGHRIVGAAIDHGVVGAILRDVDAGVVGVEHELRQGAAVVEADDGAVDERCAAIVADEVERHGLADLRASALGERGGARSIGVDKHTLDGIDS